MRIHICLALFTCGLLLSAEETEKIKLPQEIKVKEGNVFKEHFERIMKQVEQRKGDKGIEILEKATSLQHAYLQLRQKDKDHDYTFCIEYDGWFIFSSMALTRDPKDEDAISLMNAFRMGVAIKKGENQAHPFLFW